MSIYSVDIDATIDLTDLSIDDLCEALHYQIRRLSNRERPLTDSQKAEVEEMYRTVNELRAKQPIAGTATLQNPSLLDVMKSEYLLKVMGNYSLEEIERALPEHELLHAGGGVKS